MSWVLAGLFWVCLIGRPARLPAQTQNGSSGQWSAGVRVGVSPFDLDATGTALVVGGQADLPLSRVFQAEIGVTMFDDEREVRFGDIESSARTRLLLPEASLQARMAIGRFQPYVFAGAGAALRLDGFVDGGGTLHAGLGTRMTVGRYTWLRFEGRARSIRPWSGETVDLTVGLEWIRH